MIIVAYLLSVQSLPFQYYIYFLMPILLWRSALTPFSIWTQLFKQFKSVGEIFAVWIETLCYTLGSFSLVSITKKVLLVNYLKGKIYDNKKICYRACHLLIGGCLAYHCQEWLYGLSFPPQETTQQNHSYWPGLLAAYS